MKLKLGKMTLKELAEWFGISATTIRKKDAKAKRLEILKGFADYHLENSHIIIDKIYIPEFSKAYPIIKEKLPEVWHDNGLDTASRVGSEIYWKTPEVNAQISEKTSQGYAGRAKRELYGRNYIENDFGERGYSEYCWAKKRGNDCEPLSAEQLEIISDCAKETYGKINANKLALLYDALKNKEITQEEFNESIIINQESLDEAYCEFYRLVEQRLGFIPIKVTRIVDVLNFEN